MNYQYQIIDFMVNQEVEAHHLINYSLKFLLI